MLSSQTERELLDQLGGIRQALEKLASDPEIEIEAGPAMCPQCGAQNPVVTIPATESSGPLAEWVLLAECHNCNQSFYGMVESWSMFQSVEALQFELNQRVGDTSAN